jgi:hypothetical protein
MARVIGAHAGCGGRVKRDATISPPEHYCGKCGASSVTGAHLELTPDSAPAKCRVCRETLTDQSEGHWDFLDCCRSCELGAITRAISDAEAKCRAA